MIADEDEAREWVLAHPECDRLVFERLQRLGALLRVESTRQNLVSAGSLENLWLRHIVDSAQLVEHVPRETTPWLDVGSGGGFPGLVIACIRPKCEMILVESRPLRAGWLRRAADSLELACVRIMEARLERVESFSARVISARAFAPLDRLLALSARFSTERTLWLLPKGRSARQELITLADWRHNFRVEQSITDPEAGIIIGNLAGKREKRG